MKPNLANPFGIGRWARFSIVLGALSAALFSPVASAQTGPFEEGLYFAEISKEARSQAGLREIEELGAVFEGTVIAEREADPRAGKAIKSPPEKRSLVFLAINLSGIENIEMALEEIGALAPVAAVRDSEGALERLSEKSLSPTRDATLLPPDVEPSLRRLHGLRVKESPHEHTLRAFRFRDQIVVHYLEPAPGVDEPGIPALRPSVVAIKEEFKLRKVAPQKYETLPRYGEAVELTGPGEFDGSPEDFEGKRSRIDLLLSLLNNDPNVWRARVRTKTGSFFTIDIEVPELGIIIDPPPPGEPARLANASLRSLVGSGERLGIAGFVIEGEAPKRVALRGRGPSLSRFGIENPIADPLLEVFRGQERIAANDDWFKPPESKEIEELGLAPEEFLESAWIGDLEPGAYTALLREVAGPIKAQARSAAAEGDGVGVVEAFEVADGEAARFANQSGRAYVGSGERVAILGLIVEGEAPQRFVLRARGPSLADFGVAEPLEDPAVQLFLGGDLLAVNDDWRAFDGDSAAVETFLLEEGLAPADERESVIVADLDPGAYTLVVRGQGGARGVALAEAFAVE